jgi:hypothetical protein
MSPSVKPDLICKEWLKMRSRLSKIVMTACLCLGMTAVVSSVAAASSSSGAARASRVTPAVTSHQWGINVWIGYTCEPISTWEAWGRNIFKQIKALHANSVALTIPFFTDGHTANTYYAKLQCNTEYDTPTPTGVGELVKLAHADGLHVFLRPFLSDSDMVKVNPLYWAGDIAPTDPQTWFTNYLTTLEPYLKMAQSLKVEHFAISTELASMTSSTYWTFAISAAKAIYKGDLVFTATWLNSPDKKVWPGSSAGIDTYPYLPSLNPNSKEKQILGAWDHLLLKFAIPGKLSTWTDDETGIAAQNGAYAAPNLTDLPLAQYPFNQNIQANWFTSACAWVKEHNMGGIYFSSVSISSGGLLTKPNPKETFEIQPAGLVAIKHCFA